MNPPADIILAAFGKLLGTLSQQPPSILRPDMLLGDVPGLDSLRLVQAIALLEEHFDVEVNVVTLENLEHVHDVIEAISQAGAVSQGAS